MPATIEKPIFSTKKALLSFDEYACQQGVSPGVVRECVRLGIVQVRKHKNNDFVVDIPLSAYRHEYERSAYIRKGRDKGDITAYAKKVSDLVASLVETDAEQVLAEKVIKKITPKPKLKAKQSTGLDDSAIIIDETIDIIEGHQKLSDQTAQLGRLFKTQKAKPKIIASAESINASPIKIPDLHLFAQEEKKSKRFIPQQSSFARLHIPILRRVNEFVQNLQVWKVAAAAVSLGLIITVMVHLSSSIELRHKTARLNNAYASMNILIGDYQLSRQTAKTYEYELFNSRLEMEKVKKLLFEKEAELESVRQKLYEANEDMEVLKKYNSETLRQLDSQIKSITTRLPAQNK
ncbi:MAG: hypothetical protein K8R02_00715 [Anaerohalosphaeraceae bacterium]|nr:hypothetical protein [Anaerohalosphaeraceae bacterium]